MGFDCTSIKKALDLSDCPMLPGLLNGMITTPMNFAATEQQILDPEFWQDALYAVSAQRIHLWPAFVGYENLSEEPVYEDTPLALIHVRDGNYRFRFQVKESLCLHKKMYTHKSNSGRVFLLDQEGQLIGTQGADEKYRGLQYGMLNPEKMIFSDGTVSTKSPIYLALNNAKEFDRDGFIIPSSFLSALNRLIDGTIKIISAGATEILVDLSYTCNQSNKIIGMMDADFIYKLASNGSEPMITWVDNGDGTYTGTGDGLTSGVLSIRAPHVATIKGYEFTPVTVAIGS